MVNYLSQLLTLLNISGNDLAKCINVDPSVVSRWKNSQRRISSTIYFELISNCLSSNITTTLQQDTIKNMAIELHIPVRHANSNNMKKCIYDILIVSHKNSFIERSKKKPERTKQSSYSPHPTLQDILNTDHYLESVEVILGHENVIQAGIRLLQSVIDKPCALHEPISLTSLTEGYSFSSHEEIHLKLSNILSKGNTINTLIRLSQNLESNLKIVQDINVFSPSKRYHPYYIRNYSIACIIPVEFVIVPSIGALVCLGTPGNNQFHSAFLFKDEHSITRIKEIIAQAFQYSSPLIEYCEISNPSLALPPEAAILGEKFGDFFLLKDTLDDMTIPLNLYQNYLFSREIPAANTQEMLRYQEKRLYHFYKQIKNYKYYTIYKKEAVEKLVTDNPAALGEARTAQWQSYLIAHLENIVSLLQTYEHFQIALADDKNILSFNHSVKDSEAVLMYNEDNLGTEKLFAVIVEPTMVHAYTSCFFDTWNKIAPINKDKAYVISWFKKLIKSIC